MRVTCLSCGRQRLVAGDPGECPGCRYLGWAPADALSDSQRSRLRGRLLSTHRLLRLDERRAS
jgi:hypothetical protein